MVRKKTVEKAKKVIALMEKGVSLEAAAKKVGTDPRTVKKIMKKLKVRKKKVKGRILLIEEFNKRIVDGIIYYMMGGWSATRSARTIHTTLGTVKKMKVVVNNKKRSLIVKANGRYKLNVYKVSGYSTVFYGRLKSRFDNIITGTTTFKQKIGQDELRDDDYANILWQIDFDPFKTTLLPEDVCEHYPLLVVKLLRKYLLEKVSVTHHDVNKTMKNLSKFRGKYVAEKLLGIEETDLDRVLKGGGGRKVTRLEVIFAQAGVDFDTRVMCGIDERDIVDKYMSPRTFNRKKTVKDDGAFQIIVRRKSNSYEYPPLPFIIPFKHNLAKESRFPRRIK